MKHIKSINELFSLRKLFNKDEETAEGILNSIDHNTKIETGEGNEDPGYGDKHYFFNIDGFNIEVKRTKNFRFTARELKIDGTFIEASDHIINKIVMKCYHELNKERIESEEYTKKDAKIHFKNKNNK